MAAYNLSSAEVSALDGSAFVECIVADFPYGIGKSGLVHCRTAVECTFAYLFKGSAESYIDKLFAFVEGAVAYLLDGISYHNAFKRTHVIECVAAYPFNAVAYYNGINTCGYARRRAVFILNGILVIATVEGVVANLFYAVGNGERIFVRFAGRAERALVKCAATYPCHGFGYCGKGEVCAGVEGVIFYGRQISGKSYLNKHRTLIERAAAYILAACGECDAHKSGVLVERIVRNTCRSVKHVESNLRA